jgi:hypothetical protein
MGEIVSGRKLGVAFCRLANGFASGLLRDFDISFSACASIAEFPRLINLMF